MLNLEAMFASALSYTREILSKISGVFMGRILFGLSFCVLYGLLIFCDGGFCMNVLGSLVFMVWSIIGYASITTFKIFKLGNRDSFINCLRNMLCVFLFVIVLRWYFVIDVIVLFSFLMNMIFFGLFMRLVWFGCEITRFVVVDIAFVASVKFLMIF